MLRSDISRHLMILDRQQNFIEQSWTVWKFITRGKMSADQNFANRQILGAQHVDARHELDG